MLPLTLPTAPSAATLAFSEPSWLTAAPCAAAPDQADLLRCLVENARDFICQVDLRGCLHFASPSLARQLGFTPEALIGQTLCDLLHPDDVGPAAAQLHAAVGSAPATEPLEQRWLMADGRYIWLETTTAVWTGAGGQARGVILYSRDLSERRQAAEQLAASRAQLEQAARQARDLAAAVAAADRAKMDFLAGVSHELRTPLSGVLGGLSLVLEGGLPSREEEHEFINLAYKAGYTLLGLINQLLDLSSLEAGALRADLRPTAIGPVLTEVIGTLRPLAEKQGLELHWPEGELGPHVHADPGRLRQILLNLVGNAVKFTERGRVCLRVSTVGGHAEITVSDTGAGIAPETQARLFRPFARGEATGPRRPGGTGLGLYFARRLSELMRGSLTLHSAGAGQGSTFTLALPLAVPGAALAGAGD